MLLTPTFASGGGYNPDMDRNPYQSPRVPDPLEVQSLGDSGSIRQLLVEIRDAQLEMLRLNREAQQHILRTRTAMWYRIPFSLIPFALIIGFLIYNMFTRQRMLQQLPARSAPRALP